MSSKGWVSKVRVWDCDPRLLCDRHLLGQHLEVHCMLTVLGGASGGWSHHPEVRRFADEGAAGRYWLLTVHEFTRIAMNDRWPGNHDHYTHPSPADTNLPAEFEVLVDGYQDLVDTGGDSRGYLEALIERGYPRTRLEHGTPWDRDGVHIDWYLDHRRDWSTELVRALHKQAEDFDVRDAPARSAKVKMGGDGRPHLAHN